MAFSRELIRIAKQQKLPLVYICVDERYCDPAGFSIEMRGAPPQGYADAVTDLRRNWPREEED